MGSPGQKRSTQRLQGEDGFLLHLACCLETSAFQCQGLKGHICMNILQGKMKNELINPHFGLNSHPGQSSSGILYQAWPMRKLADCKQLKGIQKGRKGMTVSVRHEKTESKDAGQRGRLRDETERGRD